MEEQMTFWDHLDILRGSIIRVLVAAVLMGVGVFFLKEYLFDLVLWPRDSSFPTYRLLGAEEFHIRLVNTELTEQFMIHMKVSLVMGLLVASPYIIFELFRFITPALYSNERKYSFALGVCCYVQFIVGVLLTYFILAPISFRFLGTYQVDETVHNYISLDSYISTFTSLTFTMGLVAHGRIFLLTFCHIILYFDN